MGLGDFFEFLGTVKDDICELASEFNREIVPEFVQLGRDVIELVEENPGKTALIVGATVLTGGLANAAAPVIASKIGAAGLLGEASTGAVISTLHGAALESASLAAMGGGTLATGGGGMAAGVQAISLGGAAIGGTGSTVCATTSTDTPVS